MDLIIVKNLHVSCLIGVDNWERVKKQPLTITITLHVDISPSGDSDDLSKSVSYAAVAKQVMEHTQKVHYRSMESLALSIISLCVTEFNCDKITIKLLKPRALLHADSVGIKMTRTKDDIQFIHQNKDALRKPRVGPIPLPINGPDSIFIENLTLHTVVGVNPWEREDTQKVIINLELFVHFTNECLVIDRLPKTNNYRTITRIITKYVQESKFLTIEGMITSIAQIIITRCNIPRVTISVAKPSALLFADEACIQITRNASHFPISTSRQLSNKHIVYIAFGTNIECRIQNIDDSLAQLHKYGIIIIDSSFLYESAPMYVLDQPLFLNGVIKVETLLNPLALLTSLKTIEQDMGRDFGSLRNGPRIIDLDILFYDDLDMNTESLIIPHPRIQERAFVLKPMCDISKDFEHPTLFRTCSQLLALLNHKEELNDDVYRVMPLGSKNLVRWDIPRTLIMGILNVTPDSFSDGGLYQNVDDAIEKATEMILSGVDIIDIGGQSTRPGAIEVPEHVEMERVVSVIKALRLKGAGAEVDSPLRQLFRIPISVDTYRAVVANAAMFAGANMINDVSGGERDGDKMRNVWLQHRTPVCIMHMRGNSETMAQLTTYTDNNVVGEIKRVLDLNIQELVKQGVKRWNIIIDPGIGFAKEGEQNFQILKRLKEINGSGGECNRMPMLVGVSRKGFIGKTVGSDDPKDESRLWGTAGACTASIAGGANIVRVHDVKQMKDVVLIADKCFK